MATQLKIVNDIQRRLRETVTASIATSAYSQLLGMFVNDAIEFVDNKWFWSHNIAQSDIAILQNTTTLSNVAPTGTSTHKAFLIRRDDDKVPLAYDITDTSAPVQLHDISHQEALSELTGTASTTTQIPTRFSIFPSAGQFALLVPVATSDVTRSWRMHWYAPQSELAIDGTANDTEIKLPYYPIYLYALFLALNERGEELGEPGNLAEARAGEAIAAAMEIDMQVTKISEGKDITNLERLRNQTLGTS